MRGDQWQWLESGLGNVVVGMEVRVANGIMFVCRVVSKLCLRSLLSRLCVHAFSQYGMPEMRPWLEEPSQFDHHGQAA